MAIKYPPNCKTINRTIIPIELDIWNRNFTADEIKSSTMSFKFNKSPDIDNIPAAFLNAGIDIISYYVA